MTDQSNSPKRCEPIAIVGIGCRFADNASSPSKLWEMLRDGRSGQSDIPKNRFNIDSWFHPTKGRPGSMYSRGGYFLSHDDSYRHFDPSFFGISPLEARSMDPQQRKLLEVVYECFESAGKSLEDMSGSDTACYVGCFSTDFEHIQTKDPEYSIPYQSIGSGLTILSNRINYTFNLKGPSLTVDTACSSSLYALHLACQSLLSGDCTAAVVGGSSLIASVEKHIGSGRLGILSPTSTCHTFDSSADGFGRGDGVAAIYIKPLSAALADGDPIRAVIRATAINSNGKGPGINHPGSDAQEAVIRKAYERAGLDFSETAYFECHGTGTPVGDPIECRAIGNVFASGRSCDNPLLIGSVKTNLGHCEGASGIAGIVKAVLCLEKGLIPPNVGVKELNPNIDFKDGRLQVVRSLTPWPEKHGYRRASVNGFGYGGANAHVILDAIDSYINWEKPRFKGSTPHLLLREQTEKSYLLPISAHDEATLQLNIKAILGVCQNYKLSDVAYTLSKRSKFRSRAFGIVKHRQSSTEPLENSITFGSWVKDTPNIAFVFTGQGAQWPQMGYTLIQEYPLFRQTIEGLEKSLRKLPSPPDFSISEILSAPREVSRIYHSIHSPVCCTAVQVALTVLLRSWNIIPQAIVGHSAGEIGAAFAAGRITGDEAVAIAYYRGLAVLNCKEDGAMLAVGLGAKEVQPFLEGQPDVIIGCYNSPQSVTLSGGEHAIEEIRKLLTNAGIFARKVNSSGNAYHSPVMRSAAKEFENLFESTYAHMMSSATRNEKLPRTQMYSCITGEVLDIDDIPFVHWQRNLESPVLFDQATILLLKSEPSINHFIEIGAHSALAGPLKQIIAGLDYDQTTLKYLPTLIRGQSSVDNMLQLAGTLATINYPVNLTRLNSVQYIDPNGNICYENGNVLTNLPTYQWNYESLLWNDNRWSLEQRFRTHCRHDILGSREPGGSPNSPLWRNHLEIKHVPWLLDHKIGDDIIFPAAGYIAMAIEALNQIAEYGELLVPSQGYTISGLKIAAAMIIPTDGSIETLFNMQELKNENSDRASLFQFCLSSIRQDGKWSDHAKGTISLVSPVERPAKRPLLIKRSKHHNAKSWYKTLSDIGVTFGPTFKTLSNIGLAPKLHTASADVALQTTNKIMEAESRYIMHPTSLDGCLQLSIMAADGNIKSKKAYLPVAIEKLAIWTPTAPNTAAEKAEVYAKGEIYGMRSVRGTVDAFDKSGSLLLEGKFSFLSLEGELKSAGPMFPRQPYSRFVWKPDIDRFGSTYTRKIVDPGNTAFPPTFEQFGIADFLEILSHKGKSVKILNIGGSSKMEENLTAESYLKVLHKDGSEPMYNSYTVTSPDVVSLEEAKEQLALYQKLDFRVFDIDQPLAEQNFHNDMYDVIILTQALNSILKPIEICSRLLKPDGRLVVDTKLCGVNSYVDWSTHLVAAGFNIDRIDELHPPQVVLARKTMALLEAPSMPEILWLVYLENPHELIREMSRIATENGMPTRFVSLKDATGQIPNDANIIMAAELEAPLLAQLEREVLSNLQHLIKSSSSVIWITNGGLLDGTDSKKSLVSGITKILMTEQPSLKLSCYDMDPKLPNTTRSAVHILDQYVRLQSDDISELEMNLVEKNGFVCISRLVPDKIENSAFDQTVNSVIENGPFVDEMEMSFQRIGHMDSFYFKSRTEDIGHRSLGPEEVLLKPEAYALTAKEAAILKGQQESKFFSHELVGTVCEVGSQVTNLNVGDRVVSIHLGKFDTSTAAMQDSCCQLLPSEKIEDIIGLLLPLCTTIYALDNLLRPRKRDVILIYMPNDSLLASIFAEICLQRYIEIIVVYGPSKNKYLESKQTSKLHLVHMDQPDWITKVKNILNGKGIGAIVSSGGSEIHQELWTQLKTNGKYLFLGDKDSLSGLVSLPQYTFAQGASYINLDMLEVLNGDVEEVKELIDDAMNIFRSSKMENLPKVSVFDISELPVAVNSATDVHNHDRIVLSYNSRSTIPVLVRPKPLCLNREASFLLIGCLGGLGRSLTQWMISRGARHFIFLSRSGAKTPEARALLEELDNFSEDHSGRVTYQVILGDVSKREDVEKAIEAAKLPIRGVIQAAAVFKECLFENMTVERFNDVLEPKVQGTINLHEALMSEPLDFFVMTSSALGIKGPATESAYAAANTFLDSMARHRWSLGMQATSLALGMVQEIGHVEEHPKIEAALLQNGIYGISEAEFQLMLELACRPRDLKSLPQNSSPWDPYSGAHIVTGLEMNLMDSNPNLKAFALQDKRLRHLTLSTYGPDNVNNGSQNLGTRTILANALQSGGEEELKKAVKEILLSRFSELVMVPIEKLELGISRPIADFGMDSMVSSEVRSIAWKEFKSDIPFMKVLEKGLLLGELLELIWEKMDPNLKHIAD